MTKWITAFLFLILIMPAAATPLDLGKAAQFMWDTAKDRGTIGASIDLNGDKAIAGVIKLNATGWGPAYALAGVEVLAQDEADAIAKLSNNQRVRLTLSPAVDVFWFWRKISTRESFAKLDLLKLPPTWELLAGPSLRVPTTGLNHFTWRGNTSLFLGIRAKL